MSRIAIIGAGDFGKQVLEIITSEGKDSVVGFFDDFITDSLAHNSPILGTTDEVHSKFEDELFDAIIIAIGYNHLGPKKALFEKLSTIPFANAIHPSSVIEPSAIIGDGAVIYANSYIGHRCNFGFGVVINVGCNIPHDNSIDNCSFLSVGVQMGGNTSVGQCSFIGVGATIIDGLNLAGNITIGAGAVVINDINQPGKYIGVPAKKMIEK
ncbi:MAG: sugar O-acyltransferase (sialic acid O-acetyltransferase NeuD family) [Crocinitomicaceae bacterium]|jgi:sugar O-acyltransferase (sialic acid O-acetyltransferase NeuD family)